MGVPKRAAIVVHCKQKSYDIYIGRPTMWGNPFEMKNEADRPEVIRKYREWIVNQPELLSALETLRGKVLGCWCKPKACHGDVLVELLEARDGKS